MTSAENTSENSKINYKETLLLPETTFKMKAGAATREPEIEQFWDDQQIYFKAQEQRKASGAEKFILHDGPPYLSSDKIHIGTALNKILKDIVTRYQYQRGHYAPYVPGYDGHGLPIENAVVKSIKGGRKAISDVELRQKCRDFGAKNLKGQETNFKRLGVWGDWEHPYITTDPKFEATQIKAFYEMHKKDYVYKGLKPVYWCSHCETALADAEVEYDNHTSDSIYVKFAIDNSSLKPGQEMLKDASVVIWTTTPWTIPANLALSVHPEYEYEVFEEKISGQKYLVASELKEQVIECLVKELAKIGKQLEPTLEGASGKVTASNEAPNKGMKLLNIQAAMMSMIKPLNESTFPTLAKIKGKDLEFLNAHHPFINDRVVPILTGRHVTLEAGTGVVHTAPGHGMEDYVICQQYDNGPLKNNPIGIVSPVDAKGVFTDKAQEPRLIGQHYSKGNEIVIEILKEKGALLGHRKIDHSYPHCWRCHQPVIYRATEQWFISIDKIRNEALGEIKQAKWIPERGEARIASMVEGRGDWCISRQRVWGVPIPVFYCKACDKPLINEKTTEDLYDLFCKESSDAWWAKSAAELLSDDTTCACGSKEFTKETDIMDVWFDSGITHTAVVEARKDELGEIPVELYLEGSDQHRGWFQSSLLTSVMLHQKAPFKSVLTHGFVLDGNGRKMSKSLGNVIDPNKIMNQYGADVLRLWVASVDYSVDVRIGDEIIKQLVEVYKKVRNTMRFMLGNLAGFDPDSHTEPYENLSDLDKYTLHRMQEVVSKLTEAFDHYQFHHYYQVLQNFCVTELSSLYFDVAKDVLYCDPENAPRRRAMQTVLYEVFTTMLPMLVPVAPHLAEDIWSHLQEEQKPNYGFDMPPVSITMAPWPELNQKYYKYDEREQFEAILALKYDVNRSMERFKEISYNLTSASDKKIEQLTEIVATIGAVVQNGLEPINRIDMNKTDLEMLFLCSEVNLNFEEDLDLSGYFGHYGNNSLVGEQYSIKCSVSSYSKCERCWNYRESVGTFADHPDICERCHGAVSEMPREAPVT